jgi:hypothetical protein
MMRRIVHHLRSNIIAVIALFTALGGTSIAALTIPRGSVGTPQLRNGAVTPVKMNGSLFGGYVRAWAYVSDNGRIYAEHGFRGRVTTSTATPGVFGFVLSNPKVRGCAAMASVVAGQVSGMASGPGFADANVVVFPRQPTGVGVTTYAPSGQPTALPFVVEVLC